GVLEGEDLVDRRLHLVLGDGHRDLPRMSVIVAVPGISVIVTMERSRAVTTALPPSRTRTMDCSTPFGGFRSRRCHCGPGMVTLAFLDNWDYAP
ncbi:MAG: hypothetical protein AAB387_02290, partial [candidate division NC10 bacterium]